MFAKTDICRVMTIAALVSLVTPVMAEAAKYSTSWDGVKVEDCPNPPPDQLRIVRQLPPGNHCIGKGTSLVSVDRYLFVCENNKPVDNYDVAIGSNGLGKTTDGDRKTPVGTYELGKPRSSEQFGIFIPVGYPTRAQKAKGYTGGAVGIHGPKRQFRCIGFLNVVFDWTAGCLAVADDGFIARIARWVDAHPDAKIHIE